MAKYQDHLPLYRQEGIFGRAGVAIPQSTLTQWVGQMGVRLQPLVDALQDELLAFPVLHADEMPVAMLDPGLVEGLGSLARFCLTGGQAGDSPQALPLLDNLKPDSLSAGR